MENKWPFMERRGPAIEDAVVAAFEQRLGHRLPDDYRRFLIEVNGGVLAESNRDTPFGRIDELLSLADLDEAVSSGIPELPSRDLLLAGYADCGTVHVAVAGEHRGQVWLHDTDNERPHGSNPRVLWHDRRDMEKVADSFAEFVRLLGPLTAASAG